MCDIIKNEEDLFLHLGQLAHVVWRFRRSTVKTTVLKKFDCVYIVQNYYIQINQFSRISKLPFV